MAKSEEKTLAQKLAFCADLLRECSARGLYFSTNKYDRENYQVVQNVAMELLALATNSSLEEMEPLWIPLFSRFSPVATGDAAIIDDGKILLIRRADNGMWAMPGGALEVGESPAQGVVREALEETGISCEVVSFVGVHDSRLDGSTSPLQLYKFLFLCRPLLDVPIIDPPSHANEIREMAWFAEEELPSDISPGHVKRIPLAFKAWHGNVRAYFDK